MKNYQLLTMLASALLPFAYYFNDAYLSGIGGGIAISALIINPLFKFKK